MLTLPKRLAFVAALSACILLIPLIAMQFTTEVNWSLLDFVIAAILLFGTGTLVSLAIGKMKSKRSRIIVALVILLAFVFVWAELAVGLIGSPLAGT